MSLLPTVIISFIVHILKGILSIFIYLKIPFLTFIFE